MARTTNDGFGKDWIIENGVSIISGYDNMTVRQLYYRLVAMGMPNTMNHYKRVVSAMTSARWDGDVSFANFIDREREPYHDTDINSKDVDDEIDTAKNQLQVWVRTYRLNKWSNQPYYPVIWIEKKALQGVFETPALTHDVELLACKGYPSLTALYEASQRFDDAIAQDKEVIILYFGDHDPSGDDIPRAIVNNLARMGTDVTLDRIALTPEQVKDMGLPPAPTKRTDSRSASWDGVGQVELDAVEPRTLVKMVDDAIEPYFNHDLHNDLKDLEKTERKAYRNALVEYVTSGQFETDITGDK